MTCPVCGERKARRACPALGRQICAVCCGTKRLVEIQCPDTCGYLAAARQHPPVAVQKQYERDLLALRPSLIDLTEPQRQLCLLLLSVVAGQGAVESLDRPVDADVADAAAALAGTLETASKGVIYEHQPQSVPAQRLAAAMREVVDQLSGRVPPRALERDASRALRGIERGAREARRQSPDDPRVYLDVVRRVIRPYEGPAGEAAPEAGSPRLIVPGVL